VPAVRRSLFAMPSLQCLFVLLAWRWPLAAADEEGSVPTLVRDRDGWASAMAVGQPAQFVPGMIVGHGRYVLAEKLCDIIKDNNPAEPGVLLQLMPPPSDRFLLSGSAFFEEGRPKGQGQLVPYEGLARAIAQDVSQLPLPPSQAPTFLPAVYDFSVSFMRADPQSYKDWRFRFGERLGRGAFGEAWRAVALDSSMGEVVLKRLFVEKGEHVRLSGEREIYFGTMLQHRPHIARFIESFEQEASSEYAGGASGKTSVEMWLVFHNEGFSLTQHMFQVQPNSLVVESSRFWWLIKRQQALGDQVIKNIAYQLLHAMAVVHDMNITHRDIKGPNVFVTDTWPPVVRLGDWGSALVSPPTEEVRDMYGLDGPSSDEETYDYQPPEAVLEEQLLQRVGVGKADAWRKQAYDMWSFGVLLLELVLGTREIFKVDERSWARTEHTLLRHVPSSQMHHGRRLQAMLDLCLAPEGIPRDTPLSWFLADGSASDGVKPEDQATSVPQQGGPQRQQQQQQQQQPRHGSVCQPFLQSSHSMRKVGPCSLQPSHLMVKVGQSFSLSVRST